MEIVISRHAKRRLQLYSIDERDVIAALEPALATMGNSENRQVLIEETCAVKYAYPLKIVYEIRQARVIVITAYPLKKGAAR